MKPAILYEKLAHAQVKHPWHFLGSTAVLTLIATILAAGLEFDSSYYALLPSGMDEPETAEEVRNRTGGTRQLVIAIQGDDPDRRLEFGRKLVERLRELEQVRYADIEFPVEYLEERGLWMLDIVTLDRLIPALEEAVRIARWQANPLALHLDEEEEKRELEEAWRRVDDIVDDAKRDLPFTSTFVSNDGLFTFILVIPSIELMDIPGGRDLFASIEEAVGDLDPESHGVRARLAGTIKVFHEQHRTMLGDLRKASILALIFGVLILASFTRKTTTPLTVGAGLLTGILWTFGLARLLIGQLNVITGFLVAVLIGLGIDFGIHIIIRFRQERSSLGRTPEEALVRTVKGTLPPALTSATTTSGAFFACMIADFRGFSEFGLIAGTGVLFTLLSSFLVLPPLLYLIDRRRAAAPPHTAGRKPAAVVPSLPRTLSLAVVVIAIACAIYGAVNIEKIPFRNNFRDLRGEMDAQEFFDYVDENIGFGFNPAIVIVDGVAEARSVADAAHEKRDARRRRGTHSMMKQVFSIADLLPEQVEEHEERIDRLRETMMDPKLDRAEKKGGERAEQLARAREMVKTEPWEVKDIPEPLLRRLTTLDRSDFLVFIWPEKQIESDRLALRWEEELNEVSGELDERGIDHVMSDETLMIAWIYRLIVDDAPTMFALAIVVVLLIVTLDFRSPRRLFLVFGTLVVGTLGFLGLVHAVGVEFNLFNLIVVPCVIGIGVDNVIHIYHRYIQEGRGSVGFVVRHTGKAALLASLTTAAGFGSSLISHHLGLKSLGTLALLGLGYTLFTAAVFFPCLLVVVESLRKSDRSPV